MNLPKPRFFLYLKKSAAFLLTFYFVVSPLGILAQSSAPGTSTSQAGMSSDTASDPVSSEGGSSSSENPFQLPGGESSSSLGPQSSTVADVDVGKNAVRSSHWLGPSIFDGSFQYEVPIAIPPGRNGLEPKLSLQYSSRPASESNIFGRGWTATIPYIERRNYMGVDELYNLPTYFSSFDGELASTTATSTFKARTDNGSFLKYELTTIGTTTSSTTNSHSLHLQRTSSQYASITDASQIGLDLTPPLTISMWVKPDSAPGTGESRDMVLKYDIATSNRAYRWTYQEGSSCGAGNTCMNWGTSTDGNGGASVATAQWDNGDLTVGSWNHVVLRQTDGSNARMYLNGVDLGAPSGTLNSSIYNSNAYFGIGGNVFGANDGLIDDVRVWSRALSAAEVTNLYSSPDTFSNGSNFQGWWKLNNAYTDSSGNSNLLTGQNSPTFSTDVPFSGGSSEEATINAWTVTDRQGLTYKFGHSTSTRLYDETGGSGRIFRWMLEEVRDLNDNYISYSYTRDANQLYPETIVYTGNGSSTGKFTVRFINELRSDIATSSAEGFTVATKYRVKEIRTEVDSTWTRKYQLGYTTGDNGQRSLLSTITELGFDGSATTTLPALTLNPATSTDSWTASSTWDIPHAIVDASGADTGTRFADVNGDGLPDLIRRDDASSINRVMLNNGVGTWTIVSWNVPIETKSPDAHPGSLFMDVNGDGRTDILYHKEGGSNQIYMNNGSGWALSSSTLPVPLSDSTGKDYGVRAADINGDGLSDLVVKNVFKNRNAVYLSNGSTFATSTIWNLPEDTVDSSANDAGTRFGDINGDGLADIIRSSGSATTTYLNTGAGFQSSASWRVPDNLMFMDGNGDTGLRIDDINGDGLLDLIRNATTSSPNGVYLNIGKGWSLDSSWSIPLATVDYASQKDIGTRLFDINGDGLLDMVRHKAGEAISVYLRNGRRPDLIATTTSPQGGITGIAYQASSQYRAGSSVANPNLPLVLDTVKTLTYDDRIGSTTQKTFSYDGGQYYTDNIRDRRFAGFATTTETNDLGYVAKRFFHQGSSTQSTIGEYQDNFFKIGKVYRTETYDDSNNLYQKTISKWDRFDRGDSASFVFLVEALDFAFDGDSDHKEKLDAFSYNTASGTLVQKIEYGEVSGSDDGTYTDTGTDKLTSGYQYATSTATSTILAVSKEETVDQNSNKVRERRIYYDTLSLGSLNKGNPTKEELWVSGSSYIDTEKSYNSYGLVFEEKDPKDNTTSYVFDAANLYIATTTNPAGHVTERTYDYSSGKVLRLTDSNGNIFENVYDGFDRVTEEKQPDLTSTTTLVAKTTYQYTDTGLPTRVLKTDYLNSATSSESYIYFDGFGRKTQERIETEDSGTYSVKDTRYDQRGLVKTDSLPYFSNGTAYTGTSSLPASTLLTTFTYDPLLRAKTVANSVGTTTNAYDDWKVKVTDARGKAKDFINDAYGNLVNVVEYNSTTTATTTYEYNGNHKLTKITDSLGNIRNFTYDGLGRRLTAQDLHDTGDATFGTWTYVYDAAGNLATSTDPKGQVIHSFYDSLNRITSEDYTGASGTEVSYAYDACANGKGKLCFVSSSSATTSLSYNAIGGITAEARTIGGIEYASTTFAYDRQGGYTTVTYPDGREVAYTYDPAGKLAEVKTRASGGAWSTVLSDIDYAAHGAPSLYAYGNGISIPRTYDDTKLYRLTRIGSAGSVQDISYTYDAVGNITNITDYSTSTLGKIIQFTYDDLNRLTAASTTAASSTPFYENYSYNAIGNLLYKGSATASTSPNTHSIDLERTSSQYASIADASQVGLDLTPPLTISMWVKLESAPGTGESRDMVLKYSIPDNQRAYRWTYQEGSDCGAGNTCMNWGTSNDGNGGGSVATAQWDSGDLTVGAWQHVVLRQTNGTTARMFLNGTDLGAPSGTLNSSFHNSTAYFGVGGNVFGANDGLVDDVRVWSRVLSDSEISNLYTSPTTFVNGASLQGWWKMNGGYTDASGNGNTLVGNNSPVFSSDVPFTDDSSADVPDSYAYAETDYANPHAPTSHGYGTGTTTYAYDANGNLLNTTGAATTTFSWDYRNRMTGSATSTQTGTTTYLYDHADQRVRKASGMATTTYVNRFYDTTNVTATSSASTTAYIWVGDMLVAFIEGNGTATSTYFVHPDHLGSTNLVTNSSGGVQTVIDYYPYGEERINSNASVADRTFIAQFFDREQSLSYLNARYYQNSRGQFLSQDPVFLGDPKGQNLLNPQSLNSYSYAENNPIVKKDPTGRCVGPLAAVCIGAGAGIVGQFGYDLYNNYQANGLDVGSYTLSSGETYLTRVAQGAAVATVGLTTGGMSIPAQMAIIGGTSGATGAAGNWYLGQSVTLQSVFWDSVIGGGTFGFGKMIPGVPGRLPNFGTKAFFSGQHTQRSALELGYNAAANAFAQVLGSNSAGARTTAVQSFNASIGSSTGGGGSMPSNNSLWVTPSGAVVTWGGNLVAGPTEESTPTTIKK